MKKRPVLMIAVALMLVGAGCPKTTPTADTGTVTEVPDAKETRHVDPKTGISFVVPEGWTVGTDEAGELSMTKPDPYSTVGFRVMDKSAWQERIAAFDGVQNSDVLVEKQDLKIGGYPATMQVYRRDIGVDRSGRASRSFQYVEYFVDGGAKGYEISTSDPSQDVSAIIESVRF
jgi:hypothetical protein